MSLRQTDTCAQADQSSSLHDSMQRAASSSGARDGEVDGETDERPAGGVSLGQEKEREREEPRVGCAQHVCSLRRPAGRTPQSAQCFM